MMRNTEERRLTVAELLPACEELLARGGRMSMAWGWFPGSTAREVCYLAAPGPRRPFILWRCGVTHETLPSLAARAPALSWHEREISDLCGIPFSGHPKGHPLILHAGAEPVMPPLNPAYPREVGMPFTRRRAHAPEVAGSDIQELPFGPVRADVMESAQFLFFYLGEHILHYLPRLFFKHRGMEKRFAGLSAELGVVLAERVSGVGSVAHALAYCQAVEAACRCEVPPRARWLRVLMAELERLYNHLHYFGHLADTTTLKVGQAEGKLLEERVKQIHAVTGSRFLRNLLVPGGLRCDIHPCAELAAELGRLQKDVNAYLKQLAHTGSYLDRLITTGVLDREMALAQGATGPVARASGLDEDVRRDHAYAAYADMDVRVPLRTAGDANARAEVRAEEIEVSFALMLRLLARLPAGEVRAACQPAASAEGLGWSESPRGALFYAVHFDEQGRLARVKIRSPSFSNWRVFQYTVRVSNMMDYAINEASFGLTIAGCDR